MPVSYLVYGSVCLVVITLLIYLFNRNKEK